MSFQIQRIASYQNRCLSSSSKGLLLNMTSKLQSHQQSLPHLPVPPLQSSLEKYLLSVRPLLSKEEYRHTESVSLVLKNS